MGRGRAVHARAKRGVSRLAELQERRAHESRLTPDRALRSVDEAEAFARDRGLLTRAADSALPSFFEACHEDPYAPGSGGFGQWPATKWPWFGELAKRPGLHLVKVHNGKHVLVTDEIAALLDPICRSELERMAGADPDWALLLGHLASAGPSEPEDLQRELGLKPKDLKAIRLPLERCGAVVSRSVMYATTNGGHRHTSELARWDQVFPEQPANPNALEDLVVAGVCAAVVAPERELPRWFSWRWLMAPKDRSRGLTPGLVQKGRLERPEPGWVAAA